MQTSSALRKVFLWKCLRRTWMVGGKQGMDVRWCSGPAGYMCIIQVSRGLCKDQLLLVVSIPISDMEARKGLSQQPIWLATGEWLGKVHHLWRVWPHRKMLCHPQLGGRPSRTMPPSLKAPPLSHQAPPRRNQAMMMSVSCFVS